MSAADEIRIVVPGAVPRKNRRKGYRVVAPRGRKPFITHYLSEEWKDWIARLALECHELPKIDRGAWSLRVRQYIDKVRHLDGDTLNVALGDVDSSTSGVLDGLQEVGLLDDDARFIEEHASKYVDRANPRIEILLTRVLSDSPQLDLAGTIETGPATPKTRARRPRKPRPPVPATELEDF